ncbi:MAG: type III-B CRISPR module RAMP protein Cmr6 [Acidobacteriota bacterium]
MRIVISQKIREVLTPGAAEDSLDFVRQVENPSLILDRYAAIWRDRAEHEERSEREAEQRARQSFLDALVRRRLPATASEARRRWFESLALDPRAAVVVARLQGRLIVNQAASVLENAGLALDRTFGVPYIPGSAVKGVTRAWAVSEARAGRTALREVLAVFGWGQAAHDQQLLQEAQVDSKTAAASFGGLVAFLPAYPLEEAPLGLDIVNCHHREYYDRKLEAALDVELPVPNVFPVVEAGARFFFTVRATTREGALDWVRSALGLASFDPVERARTWLERALAEHGIGAKTAAGYGWFQVDREATRGFIEGVRQAAEAARAAAEQQRREEERRRSLTPEALAREQIAALDSEGFAHFARALPEKTEVEQRAFLAELRETRADRWRTWRKRKPDLAEAIEKVARRLGEELP